MCQTDPDVQNVVTFDRSQDQTWSNAAWNNKELKDRSGLPTDIATSQPVIKKGLPTYTMAEVAKHSSRTDAWIFIGNGVYNITKFAKFTLVAALNY